MKTNAFQSVAMISVCVLALGFLGTTPAHASVIFYGGDSPQGGSRFSSYSSSAGLAMIYDDFALSQDTAINRLWGNFSTGGENLVASGYGFGDEPVQAYYEIRTGVSEGIGGTLIQSGTINVVANATGRVFGVNDAELQLAGAVNFFLAAGNYWLGISPISEQAQLLSTTTALNAGPPSDPNPAPTGSPLANGNSYLNDANHNWLPTNDPALLGAGTWDFSYGLEGTPVPEPSTFIAGALLALPFGLQGLRYLRNRGRT